MKDETARYRALLRRDPRSRVFAPLAEAYRREGRLEEALALARAGVAKHPAYPGGRMAFGRVLLDLGRVREATEEIERAIAASPGAASAWRLLGEARARLRDRSGAFEAFARALALDPLDEGARAAVLDIDSLIASSPPAAAAPEAPPEVPPEVPSGARADSKQAARADSEYAARPDSGSNPAGDAWAADAQEIAAAIAGEPAELDLSLEVIEEGKSPTERLSRIERAWLEEGELSLLLIPEESGAEEEPREAPAIEQISGAEADFLAGRLEILDIVHSSLAPEAMEEGAPRAARADFDAGAGSGPDTTWEFPADHGDGAFAQATLEQEEERRPERETGDSAVVPPDLRTETLADLYVQQGHVDRAREIYREILVENPLHLRVKKKLFHLAPPAPPAVESEADRKIAALGRWLDRARSAADRPRSGRATRKPGIGNSPRIVTTPPTDEGR